MSMIWLFEFAFLFDFTIYHISYMRHSELKALIIVCRLLCASALGSTSPPSSVDYMHLQVCIQRVRVREWEKEHFCGIIHIISPASERVCLSNDAYERCRIARVEVDAMYQCSLRRFLEMLRDVRL
jgi:hypothetical protein